MSNKPPPISSGLIICDTVIEDRLTNKKSLIGVFNNISAKNVPIKHSNVHLFSILQDGRGIYKARVTCTHRETQKTILEISGDINFGEGISVIELSFSLRGIVFEHFGIYDFDFFCDDRPVASRSFTVSQIKG